MAGLSEKAREEFLAKLFLPLAAWGTTAVPARAASAAVTRTVKGAKTRMRTKTIGKGGSREAFSAKSLAERKQLGEKSLERNLNESEVKALEKAHRVGLGKKGADGTPAQIENYTDTQKRKKYQILRQAGFSREEAKKLMKDGVAGWKFWKKTPPPPPSTNVLTELSQESTKTESSLSVYHHGMRDFVYDGDIDRVYESVFRTPEIEGMLDKHDGIFWGRYVPRKPDRGEKPSDVVDKKGKFIIGFGIPVKGQLRSDRAGHWIHRIHWDSGARDTPELDPETVRRIFERLYGGNLRKVITQTQAQYLQENPDTGEVVKKVIVPFIFDDAKKAEVKKIVLEVLRERDSQMTTP